MVRTKLGRNEISSFPMDFSEIETENTHHIRGTVIKTNHSVLEIEFLQTTLFEILILMQ